MGLVGIHSRWMVIPQREAKATFRWNELRRILSWPRSDSIGIGADSLWFLGQITNARKERMMMWIIICGGGRWHRRASPFHYECLITISPMLIYDLKLLPGMYRTSPKWQHLAKHGNGWRWMIKKFANIRVFLCFFYGFTYISLAFKRVRGWWFALEIEFLSPNKFKFLETTTQGNEAK